MTVVARNSPLKRKRRNPRASTAKASALAHSPTRSAPLSEAVARTIADAQGIGRDLGSAGMSVARGTAKLAYDLGAVLGLAATSLISGTVEAAETIVRRTGGAVSQPPAVPIRKPLARAGRISTRRAPGGIRAASA